MATWKTPPAILIIHSLIICPLGSHDRFHEKSIARTGWLQVSLMVKAAIADGNINDCHRMSWDVPGLGRAMTSCGIKLLISKGTKSMSS